MLGSFYSREGSKLFTRYIHLLKEVALFRGMSSTDITSVLTHLSSSLHSYKKDEIICHQDETFLKIGILLTGKIQSSKRYLTNDSFILHTFCAPDVFGENIICAGCIAMPYTLQALQDSTILLIDGSSMFTMDKHTSHYMSQFLMNIIKLMADRSILANIQVDYSRITSLRKRVAIFLLNHYSEHNQLLFTVSLNRSEMAHYLSVTRPALSKVLAELKKEDIIDYYKDSFKIKDLQKLMEQ